MATLLLKHTVSEHKPSQKVFNISDLDYVEHKRNFQAFTLMFLFFKKKENTVWYLTLYSNVPSFLSGVLTHFR